MLEKRFSNIGGPKFIMWRGLHNIVERLPVREEVPYLGDPKWVFTNILLLGVVSKVLQLGRGDLSIFI